MDFKELTKRAMEIREKYAEFETKKFGKKWTNEQIAQGFVGDVGDLMKLVTGKAGVREFENIDEKLAHELSDCLWSIIVLAENFGVDLEKSFLKTMDDLENRLASEK